jgi:hypothetical protein
MPKKRGAVVIGVNKTGGLTPLESPVTGAEAFATWLKDEGFCVTIITDKGGTRVSPQQIQDAITAFVEPDTYHQLVIYFSGHGYWKNDTELWLLSDAPGDANAAVSWVETAEFAKDCGIPNVVMISDACRSIPNTTQQMKVRGSIVFPNDEVPRSRAKVDKFMAAATGRPAYEIPIAAGGTKESTFTHCFLKAFKYPDLDMISKVTEDGEEIEVVPNRRLEEYLRREVRDLLAKINVQLDQTPDAEVLSDDDVYLGRAHLSAVAAERSPPVFGPPPIIPPVVSLRDVAAVAVDRAMDIPIQLPPRKLEAIRELARTSGFDDALSDAQRTAPVSHFETETGFAVLGAPVADVATTDGGQAAILAPGDRNNPGVIRVELAGQACTAVLCFANGRGTPLAALRGYICHVLVDGNSVTNVNYVPSENSWRWGEYVYRRERLDRLRAAAAAAARHGVFRVDNKQKATDLAESIRTEKGLDPTLGLYAAYAYAEADDRNEIQSVREYMNRDVQVDLFDVLLLARKMRPPYFQLVVPFCPMLTQGWNLLRAHRVDLPKVLDDAQDELEPALWTTFKPERARLILEAVKRGEIK